MEDFEIQPDNLNHDKHKINVEIYKIWSRTKDVSRFLSIKYFPQGRKFIIDIGVTDNNSNGLKSSTYVFVDAVTFLAYINAINSGNGKVVYPYSDNPKFNSPTPESLALFGGGKKDGKPIARVFKSLYWKSGDTWDDGAFAWRCDHFDAKESSTGAFIQSSSQPISSDSIKVTRRQIGEIGIVLNAALIKDLLS